MSLYLENSDGVKSRPAWNENVPRQCLLADSSNQKKKSSERWIQIDEWKVELRTSWAESTRPGSLERMIHCPLGHFTRATSLERQLSTYSLSYHSHEGINVDFTEIGKFLRGGGNYKMGCRPLSHTLVSLLPHDLSLFQTCSGSLSSFALLFLSLCDALYLWGTLPPRKTLPDAVWHWMRTVTQNKPISFLANQCVVRCS